TRTLHSEESSTQSETRDRLATELGVSRSTIERDARYARDLDVIAKVAPDVTKDVLAGKVDGRRFAVTYAAKAAADGLDPREAIKSAPVERAHPKQTRASQPVSTPDTPPKPRFMRKGMVEGVLKVLDPVTHLNPDLDATMLWSYW